MNTTTLKTTMLVLSMIVGTLVGAPSANAGVGGTCYGVQASAVTTFDPTAGGFTGDATMRFNGGEVVVPTATIVTGATSTSHTFETPWGTIVTADELVLVPLEPGVFSLRSRLVIMSGGSGKLQLLPASTLDTVNGIASWHARGHICFDAIVDH